MKKKPSKFAKIFGSGPAGLVISLILFLIAAWLDKRLDLPRISNSRVFLDTVFYVSIFLTVIVIIWSFKSLPAADRGTKLSTAGAFKYVRHPLYAAFLSIFDFGLAVYLNSYIYVLWALLLHPVWHYVIKYEEKLMINVFGKSYVEYQKRTGRFFPRLIIKK